MYRRVITLAVLSVFLLTLQSGSVRSAHPCSKLAKGGLSLSLEQLCINTLQQPGLSADEREVWLGRLGQCGRTQAAVGELIRWLEYNPEWERISRRGMLIVGFPPQTYPAANALKVLGPIAAPQLVHEYVYFFETTALAAWGARYTRTYCDPETLKEYETQNPCWRLSCIASILSCDRDMAKKTVESARHRMRMEHWNDRTVRACQELIGRIKPQFPESEHPKLFPNPEIAD